jgi:hypothetical protein
MVEALVVPKVFSFGLNPDISPPTQLAFFDAAYLIFPFFGFGVLCCD